MNKSFLFRSLLAFHVLCFAASLPVVVVVVVVVASLQLQLQLQLQLAGKQPFRVVPKAMHIIY